MKSKYSVFLGNVGTCSDRYCASYAPQFSIEELFKRAASIELLSGVDLVATPDLLENLDTVKKCAADTNLKIVSVAVDHFTQAKWRQGSFSSIDPEIRKAAVTATTEVMDVAKELDCDLVTIWPGQDGYDYIFQADYMQERNWFAEGVKEACRYRDDVKITLEYKLKEPRTHSYVNTVGTTILLVQEIKETNCGVALDYGHALLGYENPAESAVLLQKYGNLLYHIHINDNYRYWDDDMIVGSIHTLEYLEFFYWLKKLGYNSWITIDQFPYREDGRDAVAESAEWMAALEDMLDKTDPAEISSVLAKKDSVAASRLMRKMILNK
ncbi:MAG: sugar phosphate isomerase/epimerase family protein [Planctomycetota bacterium]|jgi:xylose isomerase